MAAQITKEFVFVYGIFPNVCFVVIDLCAMVEMSALVLQGRGEGGTVESMRCVVHG